MDTEYKIDAKELSSGRIIRVNKEVIGILGEQVSKNFWQLHVRPLTYPLKIKFLEITECYDDIVGWCEVEHREN